jgi:hypothetical protein
VPSARTANSRAASAIVSAWAPGPHAADQVADHRPLERVVAKPGAQRVIDAGADGPGRADPGVDRAGVLIGARVRLAAAEDPLGRGVQAVQIDVGEDRVDRADLAHQVGRDHLGAGAVLGLGGQHEAAIAAVVGVALVIVVIDPRRQPIAEPGDERQGDLVERDRVPTVAANATSVTTTRPCNTDGFGRLRGAAKYRFGSAIGAHPSILSTTPTSRRRLSCVTGAVRKVVIAAAVIAFACSSSTRGTGSGSGSESESGSGSGSGSESGSGSGSGSESESESESESNRNRNRARGRHGRASAMRAHPTAPASTARCVRRCPAATARRRAP